MESGLTISKHQSGFPEYLDFTKLRTDGIHYLGELAGKIWSDHNLHDPGITTLEVLCYALLDLGYRTNLPIENLLAKNPADPEDNFFTPAQILTNNPLTILDYRKLLIDIPGIRNAWLEPATDIKDLCRSKEKRSDNTKRSSGNTIVQSAPCNSFLNGLYHVIVETDINPDEAFLSDEPGETEKKKKEFIVKMTDKVRKQLMSHRNLCEDVADIFVLCKVKTGICATVEIEKHADPKEVYKRIANRLHQLFSPEPTFYTLQQLLDKGLPIEEIFAGRPYSEFSHGFTDSRELEEIRIRKQIHTSDIYQELLKLEGVRRISRLRFRNCGKPCGGKEGNLEKDKWINPLPKNHIPIFALDCSGIDFTINGLPLNLDLQSLNAQIIMGWKQNGKIGYHLPSPYLDMAVKEYAAIPDIAELRSVQYEYPAVYGIGEGQISDDAAPLRKAQVQQLRGYLMFFDQVLANYLSQLQHLRQLFSMHHPASPSAQHTYFLNTIREMPEMEKLFRYAIQGNISPAGTPLAFPVAKNAWTSANFAGQSAATILASLPPYTVNNLTALSESVDLVRQELKTAESPLPDIRSTQDGKFLYALPLPDPFMVLVSSQWFPSSDAAKANVPSLIYAGAYQENYETVVNSAAQYSFEIRLNLVNYTDYLTEIAETPEMYQDRRTGFLKHLLARFAEQFTDFVIYNWKGQYGQTDIHAAENYLTQYPELSRNRGKGYDYSLNGLIPDNVSGFERKVRAIAGMTYTGNHLCHFVVEPFNATYFHLDKSEKKDGLTPLPSLTHLPTTHVDTPVSDQKGFIYRLVNKDRMPAAFSKNYLGKPTVQEQLLIWQATMDTVSGIPSINLSKSGPVKHNSKYKYQICVTDLPGLTASEPVFVSTMDYYSSEMATLAMNNDLLAILKYAAATGSYGDTIAIPGKPRTNPLVEIPADAASKLELLHGSNWIAIIAALFHSNHIHSILIHDPKIAGLFCEGSHTIPTGAKDELAYYFSFSIDDGSKHKWTSTKYFNTVREVIEEFNFFKILIHHAGNIYADCGCIGDPKGGDNSKKYGWKLLIREVLAQSVDIFATEALAWGPEGIEKFICAVQSKNSSWHGQRGKDCFGFHITCGPDILEHPCTYPSALQRDQALEKLKDILQHWPNPDNYSSGTHLLDSNNEPFAAIILKKENKENCELLVLVAEYLSGSSGKAVHDADGFLLIQGKTFQIRSTESRKNISPEALKQWTTEWQQKLQQWACRFPISKKQHTGANGKTYYTYCVEIRADGFNDCQVAPPKEGLEHNDGLCDIAWKLPCCFNSCTEAMIALKKLGEQKTEASLLKKYRDCATGEFGIAVHEYAPKLIQGNNADTRSGYVIAVNPQCYPDWDSSCEADSRMRKLVNLQGLKLIEHILLRPMLAEDCRCRKELAACHHQCTYPSWIQQDQQCETKQLEVCFKPGEDPYSFIATVFLPAWGERFRDHTQRALVEHLLYREAPAHILLRVIWLRPFDFCRLETHHLLWQKWIAGINYCNSDFSVCQFLQLLFHTYYECMPLCNSCLPCEKDTTGKTDCWEANDYQRAGTETFVDQVNAMYCLADYCGRKKEDKEGNKPK